MKACPTCKREYQDSMHFCPRDGTPLERKGPTDELIGSLIDDKYRVLEKVGEGGMGSVYKAVHTEMRSTVALKFLHPHLLSDENALERFRREARATVQIRHPNAVLVTDFGVARDTGLAYLVMEFLDGQSLAERIQGRWLEYEQAATIIHQVCLAVQAAHAKGIIHRDLKPDNILLVPDDEGIERVKVLDFGLAKLSEQEPGALTKQGTIMGTPYYMSPEQCLGEELDARSDIYSIGVITYQLLTGEVPFHARSLAAVMTKHLHEIPRRPSELRIGMPVAVEQAILKALEKKREDRQPKAMEFARQFEDAISSAASASKPELKTPVAIPLPPGESTVTDAKEGSVGQLADPNVAASKTPDAPIIPEIPPVPSSNGLRVGRCTNSPRCEVAREGRLVHLPSWAPFSCPGCRQPLTNAARASRITRRVVVVGAGLAALLGTGAIILASSLFGFPFGLAPQHARVLLRLRGSNTIGSTLGPELAAEFLRRQGARNVKIVSNTNTDQIVQGELPPGYSPVSIEIQAHGSATAFPPLLSGESDIGMASRSINPEEVAKLASLGDMKSITNEHVLGLDGIAVIVNTKNPIQKLTREQLGKIFAGDTRDWSEVGGQPGPISVYSRTDESGTYDTFKTLVLGARSLVSTAKRIEDSSELSDAVAANPGGIGFIGLPYVRSARAIAVSDGGSTALLPNRLTVATEDYVLARRLFLYTPVNPPNPMTRQFVQFALSNDGQDIVDKEGFVSQKVAMDPSAAANASAPDSYKQAVKGAMRLSLNFRFRPNSGELDNKAVVDLDRLVDFISSMKYSGQNIVLLGFADAKGSAAANLSLSDQRAKSVGEQLGRRGLSPSLVEGFGSDLPVASNDTDDGRERNRRVEIWIRK